MTIANFPANFGAARLRCAALLLAAVVSGCSAGPDRRPMPRREGYPRLAEYPAEYVSAEDVPVATPVNAHARVRREAAPGGAVWLTVSYPRYAAEVYYTYTPVRADDMQAVLDNRMERMSLDLAGSSVQWSEWTACDGEYAILAEAPSALTTPLKLVRVAPGWVVTATAYFRAAGSVDSVAPAVNAIKRDIFSQLFNQ